MRYQQNNGSSWAQLAVIPLIVASLSTGVCQAQARDTIMLSPTQSALAVRALRTWFECEECESGELAAVTKYGQAVVPCLAAALHGGLSPATREEVRGQLEERYTQLAERSEKNSNAKPAGSRAQFIALYLGNRDAQYRVRAAEALAVIGGPRARAELENGLRRRQRDDVQAAIKRSLTIVR